MYNVHQSNLFFFDGGGFNSPEQTRSICFVQCQVASAPRDSGSIALSFIAPHRHFQTFLWMFLFWMVCKNTRSLGFLQRSLPMARLWSSTTRAPSDITMMFRCTAQWKFLWQSISKVSQLDPMQLIFRAWASLRLVVPEINRPEQLRFFFFAWNSCVHCESEMSKSM